ncbi:unnamed protein product [Musa acuminata subsp. malaccensis]|uniref:(wild Malaysian banana) hypothetical protein n=1 Tax=Musa acuminata subsp. malaccensis TaxID=214687 RepID=A0A804J4V6_MUSAM|nr:PREDICTED: uncharacterized protein LOC103985120 [Musa acuminata subsp. malaccensis]CAG1838671.1 unnamed protein product [Musa acuminata subsp. malaccensis]
MTREMISNGLRQLANMHDGIEDLLRLPSIQQGLFYSDQRKWLEEDVEGLMRLLDLCGTMKDATTTLKEYVHDLRFALGRRGDNSTGQRVQDYVRSRKEIQKIIKKSYKDLKQMDGRCQPASLISQDPNLSVVLNVLNEAREITISLLCSILSLMFLPKAKTSRWSFASKTMRVACKEDLCEMWDVDVSLRADLKDADAEKIMMVQNQLKTIEISFGDVENGLGCLFRRLIQNRVSLLNILSP